MKGIFRGQSMVLNVFIINKFYFKYLNGDLEGGSIKFVTQHKMNLKLHSVEF